jgi:hypothetical protein
MLRIAEVRSLAAARAFSVSSASSSGVANFTYLPLLL